MTEIADDLDADLAAASARGEASQAERYSVERQEIFTEEEMLHRFAYLRSEKAVVDREHPELFYSMKAFRELTASSRDLVEHRLNRNVERRLTRDAEESLRLQGALVNTETVRAWVAQHAQPEDWIDKYELIADRWLRSESRVDVHGFTFEPNAPRLTENMYYKSAINLWSPPRILKEPLPPDWKKRAEIFEKHIFYLLPNIEEANIVLKWIAHVVQRPQELPGWHILLVAEGVQGTGRNWIARCLSQMMPETTVEDLPLKRLLDGKFNGEIDKAVLGVVDEIREGGKDQWEKAEDLKSFLSAKSRTINPKFQRVFAARNFMRVMMFSNFLDALPLPPEDRRHYVGRCTTIPESKAYYDKLYGSLKDRANLRSFWEYLTKVDLEGFDIEGRAPASDMKDEMITESRADEETELRRIIKEWPGEVMRGATLRKMLQDFRDNDLLFGEERHKSDQLSTGHLRRLYRVCGVKSLGQVRMISTDGLGAKTEKKFRVVAIRNVHQWKKKGEGAWRDEVERSEAMNQRDENVADGKAPQ